MEIRIGSDRAREITDRLPFDGAIHTDTIGFTGGLWMLWHSDRVEVNPLATTEQEIHAVIKVISSNSDWLFTAVYASPRSAERQILWNNLNKAADLHSMPWVLAGDFNEPLLEDDKFGGRTPPSVSQWQIRLSDEVKDSISGGVMEEEIKTAFVPGRKGIDNAIIIQEIIHTLSKKRGKVGYMAIKIDLEKAYDKLEWSFIRDMLIRFNFPSDIIDIIMSYVSTVSTSILFNGEALDLIYPSRGIRQGDSLSLADNINCGAIRDVIDEFCSVSGQSISESKSKVYFSPNVDRDTRESLCDILRFNSTPNLGKYLGFPIKHSRTSAQDFNFILDKVKQKLAGWKANMLSLAGCSVLIQASSATIPSYVMQGVYLPQKILDGIVRVNQNFLWGSSDAAKKIHWVGWHKVAKPKEEGGLGFLGKNVALLAKLNWRFHMERGKPWAEVLKMKYCNQRRVLEVKDIIKDTGWDWDQIPFDLPSGTKMMIQVTPLSLTSRGGDKLTWAGNPRGIFDLKSAYSLAIEVVPVPPFSASWIWKAKTLPQSILHALRDCSSVKFVWRYLGIQATNCEFWNANLQEWLNANGRISPIRKVIKRIRWERPPEGWAKLNTNGALCTHSGSVGCGGVVRDDRGEWMAGFSRRIGATNSFMAKFWGLRDGLILCCNLHIPSLIVELDAKAIVDALLNLNYENNVISPILDDCRQLVTQFHRIQFKHCYREANQCADVLARRGAEQDIDFLSFLSPPEDILNVFMDDFSGMHFNRQCLDLVVMF
ncbi:uncharacterized protein LOC126704213 [Quercus robur]|uniref:uncharacterized protein LOC126704213 n=1 Tax=Quercus robur TaxID=38942 RepID=UPI002162BE39|nr:uncharacterized protein LOC126704213 [Quercus robur]